MPSSSRKRYVEAGSPVPMTSTFVIYMMNLKPTRKWARNLHVHPEMNRIVRQHCRRTWCYIIASTHPPAFAAICRIVYCSEMVLYSLGFSAQVQSSTLIFSVVRPDLRWRLIWYIVTKTGDLLAPYGLPRFSASIWLICDFTLIISCITTWAVLILSLSNEADQGLRLSEILLDALPKTDCEFKKDNLSRNQAIWWFVMNLSISWHISPRQYICTCSNFQIGLIPRCSKALWIDTRSKAPGGSENWS